MSFDVLTTALRIEGRTRDLRDDPQRDSRRVECRDERQVVGFGDGVDVGVVGRPPCSVPMKLVTLRWRRWTAAWALLFAVACGDADEPATTSGVGPGTAATGGSGSGEGDDESADDGDGSGGDDGDGTGADGTAGEGTAGSGGDDSPTGGDSGPGPMGACDPQSTPFDAQASISFDTAAMSCAVAEGTGTDPQLIIDRRDTGLFDLTGQGLTLSPASSGTFINSTVIVGIMPAVPISVPATVDADGTAITIEFEISTVGPVITADAMFGG